MKLSTKGYNIPVVTDLGTFTSGTAKETGTPKDYDNFRAMIEASGICYGEITIGSSFYTGYAICNPYDSGIELIITTNYGGSLAIISGLYYVLSGKAYMEFTVNSLS